MESRLRHPRRHAVYEVGNPPGNGYNGLETLSVYEMSGNIARRRSSKKQEILEKSRLLDFLIEFSIFRGDAAAHHTNTLMRTRRWEREAATARRHHASPLGARGSGIGKSAGEWL